MLPSPPSPAAMSAFPFNWVPQRVGSIKSRQHRHPKNTFPFNWVPQRVGRKRYTGNSKGFTKTFPFNWVPQRVGSPSKPFINILWRSFHSIGFPSEWGANFSSCNRSALDGFPFNWVPQRVGSRWVAFSFGKSEGVSIQLGSPASGENHVQGMDLSHLTFPFNWVPQRVGSYQRHVHRTENIRFPFNWVPQRVGRNKMTGRFEVLF